MTVPATLKSLQRHDTYHIPTADMSIIVENVQFRVHRYFFERESDFFKVQLSTSVSPGGQSPGSDDSNSIILDEVTPSQFATFLWVFYNPRYSLYDEASLEDWETILRLSHRWIFPEVKKLAIRELQKKTMTPVKRIALYHEFEVDQNLLIPEYAALCEREHPLTLQEGLALGMETTLMVAWGREAARSKRLEDGDLSALQPTLNWKEMFAMVRDIFRIPPVEGVVPPIDGDTTMTPTDAKQPPPPPAKDPVNGLNSGASPTAKMIVKPNQTVETPKKDKKVKNKLAQQPTPKAKQEMAKNAKEKPTDMPTPTPTSQTGEAVKQERTKRIIKEGSESQPSVAEQQETPAGSGKPVGGGTDAVRSNNETEKDKKSQTDKPSEAGDSTTTKSEGGDGVANTTNSANGDTTATTTIETGGTDKLHIQTGFSATVGSVNGAGSGLKSTTEDTRSSQSPLLLF